MTKLTRLGRTSHTFGSMVVWHALFVGSGSVPPFPPDMIVMTQSVAVDALTQMLESVGARTQIATVDAWTQRFEEAE